MIISEEEIAKKLYRKHAIWTEGPPKVIILPPVQEGFFAILRFCFPDDYGNVDFKFLNTLSDEVFAKANFAVLKFQEIITQWFREMD